MGEPEWTETMEGDELVMVGPYPGRRSFWTDQGRDGAQRTVAEVEDRDGWECQDLTVTIRRS